MIFTPCLSIVSDCLKLSSQILNKNRIVIHPDSGFPRRSNMKILVIFLSCSLLGISAGYRVRRSDSSSDEKEVKEEEKEVSAEEVNFSGESETYNCKDLTQKVYHELNQICEDCYSLHNQPEIYTLCR
jgi:hypothetical protein